MRKIIIISFISVLILLVLAYFGKELLLKRIESGLIESVESSTPKGLTIEDVGYLPFKGVHLAGVALYEDKTYQEKEFYIPSLYIKFPLVPLLINKTFSPVITIDNFESERLALTGSFGFSVKLPIKIENIEDALKAIKNVEFDNLSLVTPVLDVQHINGAIKITKKAIRTFGLNFVLNGEPCKLNVEVLDPAGDVSAEIKASSPKINVIAEIEKKNEIYKISEMRGVFLNSSFDFTGEVTTKENGTAKNATLSLYGEADIDINDALHFAPRGLKDFANSVTIEGKIKNSIYVKCNLADISRGEFGVKSSADYIKIWELKIDRFYTDMRAKNRIVEVPIINAYPYDGVISASAKMDLSEKLIPYQFDCKISNIDIAKFFNNTKLGGKNIKGLLSSDFVIKGLAKNINSMEGSGKIVLQNANLGPMPLLTPLLGHLYGYLQSVMPDLKQVNITNGLCNFYITDRKVITENLVLRGELMSINAKGYIDFDKNLNFVVENEFVEPEKVKETESWRANLQKIMVGVGKMVSKAYLTGTLEKPKWKFVYMDGMQNMFKGGFDQLLKGIFEQ